MLRVFNWTNIFDTDAQTPYAYSSSVNSSNKQWVGYDDLKSVTIKVLNCFNDIFDSKIFFLLRFYMLNH
jgi:hypothetical protein